MISLNEYIDLVVKQVLNEDYYKIDPTNPPPIKDILKKWVDGEKVYDPNNQNSHGNYYHALYPLSQIRLVPSGNELRYDQNSEEFKELVAAIKRDGIKEPIIIMVGKNGKIKIGEGNHRLAAIKQLDKIIDEVEIKLGRSGLSRLPTDIKERFDKIKNTVEQIPVRFEFYINV